MDEHTQSELRNHGNPKTPLTETKIYYYGLLKTNFSNNNMLILSQKYKIYGFLVIHMIKIVTRKFNRFLAHETVPLKQGP